VTTRRTFDQWTRAQEVARQVIQHSGKELGVSLLGATAAELAGLELCPFRIEVRRFNRLRLAFLERLLAEGWSEADLVEVCHAKPDGIQALARQLLGQSAADGGG
jgi:hypothetical protein